MSDELRPSGESRGGRATADRNMKACIIRRRMTWERKGLLYVAPEGMSSDILDLAGHQRV